MSDEARERFGRTAERIAALQDERAPELAARVRRFVSPAGSERALDAGCGAGALALALAPFVREVVGVDLVPELLAKARERAVGLEHVQFVEGDATRLPFDSYSFDLTGTLRTLHHVERPELVLAEITRVTRPGGVVLVVDQIGPFDPLAAVALDQFEQARDPTHTRLLPDADMRQLFEANSLVLRRDHVRQERRDLEPYLDLAGCEGYERDRARAAAPHGPSAYTATVAWYLLDRR